MKVNICIIEGGRMPEYKSNGAACADCYARLNEDIVIPIGKRAVVPLGFMLELPYGWEAQMRPRSGMSKNGYDVSYGTIDSDYRGEVCAIVANLCGLDIAYKVDTLGAMKELHFDGKPMVIHNGDRICQMKIEPVYQVCFNAVSKLSDTERGSKGFGSTDIE